MHGKLIVATGLFLLISGGAVESIAQDGRGRRAVEEARRAEQMRRESAARQAMESQANNARYRDQNVGREQLGNLGSPSTPGARPSSSGSSPHRARTPGR